MPQRKFKICYLIHSLSIGGAEMMLYQLLKNIDLSSYEPCIITFVKNRGWLLESILGLNVPVYNINVRSKADVLSIWKIHRLIKTIKPEILQTYPFSSDFVGRVVGSWNQVPVIISSIHSVTFGGKIKEHAIRYTDKYALKATAICEAAADIMKKKNLVSADKLKVIYNGIELKDFSIKLTIDEKEKIRHSLGLITTDFFLLAVGRLSPPKGYSFLFEAISLLQKKGHRVVKLVIAGDGELRNALEKQVEQLNIKDSVFFLGLTDDIPRLMASADTLVLSSLWEGLPIVVLEAMASQLPVVSTSVGGIPELVIEKETGFLVSPQNPQRLADALEKMVLLPVNERKNMGLKGRERVVTHFTIDKMVAAYEQLYMDCLQEKGLISTPV